MAKKSKGKLQTRKEKRRGHAARREERRFVSQTSTSPSLVKLLGAIAGLVLGAGAFAWFFGQSFAADEAMRSIPSFLIAGGAVMLGITIWIGTSTEATVRVGDPGIAVEKGDLRRMPWWTISKISFEGGSLALVVDGKDESGVDWTLKLPVRRHPDAVGWLVREASDRIPRRVDIDESTQEKLPGASASAGEKIELEPLQVVGKRCAASGKVVSYEPDGRVCTRCERVYLKTAVPKKCKCGNSLLNLRPKDADGTESESESDAEESADDEEGVDSTESETAAAGDDTSTTDERSKSKSVEATES